MSSSFNVYNTIVANSIEESSRQYELLLAGGGGGGQGAPFPDGTEAEPSINFENDTASGLYLVGTDDLGISVNGTQYLDITEEKTQIFNEITFNNADAGLNVDQQCRLATRLQISSFPVPAFEPVEANSVIAFDIAPSASGLTDQATNGVAWVDICDAPVLDVNPALTCLRLGNMPTADILDIGCRVFNTGSLRPIHMRMVTTAGLILDTDARIHTGPQEKVINLPNRQLYVTSGSTDTFAGVLIENSFGTADKKTVEMNVRQGYYRNFLWEDDAITYYSPLNMTHNGTVAQILFSDAQNTSPTAVTSAVVAIDSTTQGFLPPRMTTAQRDAIASPAAGLIVYNTTTNVLDFYNGTVWGPI